MAGPAGPADLPAVPAALRGLGLTANRDGDLLRVAVGAGREWILAPRERLGAAAPTGPCFLLYPPDRQEAEVLVATTDLGRGIVGVVDGAICGIKIVSQKETPGLGAKVKGSSALMRHSIAWPRNSSSSCVTDSGLPAAMRICSRTRSTPVIASVTGCST